MTLNHNNEEEWLDSILATHRSETWAAGWNNEATENAKAAIQAHIDREVAKAYDDCGSKGGTGATVRTYAKSRADQLKAKEES